MIPRLRIIFRTFGPVLKKASTKMLRAGQLLSRFRSTAETLALLADYVANLRPNQKEIYFRR